MYLTVFSSPAAAAASAPCRYNSSELYADTIDALGRYYAPANEALYSLMEALGPGVGWEGRWGGDSRPRAVDNADDPQALPLSQPVVFRGEKRRGGLGRSGRVAPP